MIMVIKVNFNFYNQKTSVVKEILQCSFHTIQLLQKGDSGIFKRLDEIYWWCGEKSKLKVREGQMKRIGIMRNNH